PFDGNRGIAFTPDGGRLVTVSGGLQTTFKEVKREVQAPGPDGKTQTRTVVEKVPVQEEAPIVVRLWDAATGKEALTLEGTDKEDVQRLTFSPDGKLVAAPGAGMRLEKRVIPETVTENVPVKKVREKDGKKEEYTEMQQVAKTVHKEILVSAGAGDP